MSDLSWLDLDAIPDAPPEPAPVPDQVREAMRLAGVSPPQNIVVDGCLHRFSTKDAGGDDAGWYIIYPGPVSAGAFGDWRTGSTHTFRQDLGHPLTSAEQAALELYVARAREAREAELKARHKAAAARASKIWDQARPAKPDHPYLVRKGIGPHGARQMLTGELLVPMYAADGELSSLQYILADGDKRFLKGGATAGVLWCLGDLPAPRVYIAEGYATAASIREATGRPVIVAFSAGNLESVAKTVRADLPTAEIVIVGDNDVSGTGQAAAEHAAKAAGARVIIPPTPGQDANDYAQSGGDLKALLEPAPTKPAWLVSALDWAKQGPPVEWVIKGLVQRGELHMVHGPSGCGKTFIVLDWILSVASGLDDWQGHKVTPGGVVYLAGEGHYGLRARIAAWMQAKGAVPEKFWLSRSATSINRPADLAEAVAEIRALPEPPRVIVIDTLHRFYEGNENDAEETRGMIAACGLLSTEFDKAAVILVHHTGVSEEAQTRGRGSSSWRAALQLEYSVRPAGEGRVIQQMKNKDGELMDDLYAELDVVAIDGWCDEDGEPVTSVVPSYKAKPKGAADRKLLEKHGWLVDAWKQAGQERVEDTKYISASAIEAWLVTTGKAKTHEAARKQTELNDKAPRMMMHIVNAGMAQAYGDGFLIFGGDLGPG